MNNPTNRFDVRVERQFPPDEHRDMSATRTSQALTILTGMPSATTRKLVELAAASGSWIGRLNGYPTQITLREDSDA